MPRCAACGLLYPRGERFCGQDGAALLLEETPSAPIPIVDLVGQMVGTYRITKKIGEGGMGAVYEAVHPVLDRKIAMKIVLPPYARDPQVVARFFDEARALGKIQHPNIVEVYDLGQLEDGTVFLAMELLTGRDLRTRLREGVFSPEELRAVFLPMAEGLGAAHAAGIIHRDLKPENIFLCEQGGVKILDFGVVKLTDRADGAFARTHTGVIVGTPEYMSPEQAAGKKELDHRSDIYSFGLLLYEALCGHRPFAADSLYEVLTQQVQGVFPSPSERAGRPLDKMLEAVTQKCLAKDPKDRYWSMAAVIKALGSEEATTPAPLKPASPPRSARTPSKPGLEGVEERSDEGGGPLEGVASETSRGRLGEAKLATEPKAEAEKTKETHGEKARPGPKRLFVGAGAAAALLLGSLFTWALLDTPQAAPREKESPPVSLEALATYLPESTQVVIDLDLSQVQKTKETKNTPAVKWLSLIEPVTGFASKVDPDALSRVVLGVSLGDKPRLEAAVLAGRIKASAVEDLASAQNLSVQTIPEGVVLRAQAKTEKDQGRFTLSSAAKKTLSALPPAPLRVVLQKGELAQRHNLLKLSSYRQALSGAGAAVLASEQGPMLHLLLQTKNAVHAWDLQGSLLKHTGLPDVSWRVKGQSLWGIIPLARVTLSKLASLSW